MYMCIPIHIYIYIYVYTCFSFLCIGHRTSDRLGSIMFLSPTKEQKRTYLDDPSLVLAIDTCIVLWNLPADGNNHSVRRHALEARILWRPTGTLSTQKSIDKNCSVNKRPDSQERHQEKETTQRICSRLCRHLGG